MSIREKLALGGIEGDGDILNYALLGLRLQEAVLGMESNAMLPAEAGTDQDSDPELVQNYISRLQAAIQLWYERTVDGEDAARSLIRAIVARHVYQLPKGQVTEAVERARELLRCSGAYITETEMDTLRRVTKGQ